MEHAGECASTGRPASDVAAQLGGGLAGLRVADDRLLGGAGGEGLLCAGVD
jgi:hypothetical protein